MLRCWTARDARKNIYHRWEIHVPGLRDHLVELVRGGRGDLDSDGVWENRQWRRGVQRAAADLSFERTLGRHTLGEWQHGEPPRFAGKQHSVLRRIARDGPAKLPSIRRFVLPSGEKLPSVLEKRAASAIYSMSEDFWAPAPEAGAAGRQLARDAGLKLPHFPVIPGRQAAAAELAVVTPGSTGPDALPFVALSKSAAWFGGMLVAMIRVLATRGW